MTGGPPPPIEGIVAFTFAEGSDEAQTLVPQYTTSAIDASASFDDLAQSRTASLRARGEIGPAPEAPASATEGNASMTDPSSTNDDSNLDDGAAPPEDPAPPEGGAALDAPNFSVPSFSSPDFSSPDLSSPDGASPSFTPPSAGESAEVGEAAPPATDTSAASALPAHLALPSFPKFDINFDASSVLGTGTPAATPPEEPDATGDNAGAADMAPAAAPAMDAPPAPPGMPAHLVPGALPGGGPPRPPPTPPKPPPAPPVASMPALPNLGLPMLGDPEPKKEVTLLGDEAAQELAAELKQRRSALPLILLGVLLVGGIGAGGFWQKDAILALIVPAKTTAPVITPREKAEAALAEGVLSAKSEKWREAIKSYQDALELEPNLSQAHLRLAVAYAKTKKEERAVEHYKKYVQLEPDAPNAKEVQKIIDDFEKAKAKDEEEKKTTKKKKRKR